MRLRDWALIEIQPEKHLAPIQELKNGVILIEDDTGALSDTIDDETHARDRPARGLTLKKNLSAGILTLKGTIPEQELQRPPLESKLLDEPAIIVAMRGGVSEFKIGIANKVLSVIRMPFFTDFESEEWCILGRKTASKAREHFSTEGDSGSCMFDIQGRIRGIMSAGAESASTSRDTGNLDTTYAAPIEWLLADIRANGFNLELL